MKKISIALGLIVSAVILLGCASKAASTDQAPVAQPVTHQDLKGEVGK
jgi:PBP1b-binding outer membrane lipoprotein LpoB